MDDYRRLNALTLLRCAIYSSVCAFSLIAQADRVIPFEVPASGSKTGTYGYTGTAANGATYQAYGKWNTQSRFVNPKASPIGAGASGFGGASYGFRGTVSVGSSIFKQLLLLEGAFLAFDWIKSQYYLPQGFDIDEQLNAYKEITYSDYLCDVNECYWKTYGDSETKFSTFGAAVTAGIQNYLSSNPVNCRTNKCFVSEISINSNTKNGNFKISYITQSNGSIHNATSQTIPYYGGSEKALAIGEKSYRTEYALGEPTRNPDPHYTAAILDRFAGQLPALRERVSDNVDFLASPFRFTRKAADGAILEDWEGVLEPMDYPVINPYKTAVPAELPRVEPTPQLKTKNLLNGEEITTTTDPVTQPTGDPAAKDKVDLSKLEAYTAGINAATNAINQKMPELANQELEYTPDDSEIPVNDDLTAEEATTAIARLFVPTVTNPNTLLDTFIPLANDFNVQPILSDSSDSCPAPITLATIGGQRVQMSFDSICEFLRLIKKMILPAIGFFMALSWIKRISAAGG